MILVTGATGLVGSHLLLKLTEGKQTVRAIYRSTDRIKKVEELFAFAKAQSKEISNILGAEEFVQKAKEDANELLVEAAQKL